MAASAGSGLGLGTLAAGAAVAAVVGVVGYQIVFAPGPDPVPDAPPQEVTSDPAVTTDPVASPVETSDATVPEIAADPVAAPVLIAPSFDLVRVDAAGGALIAGQAEGNAELRLRLDGQEIHLASSDAGGDFVAMFDLPPSELPRVLSLEMLMEDGTVLVSDQSVIISPTLRPRDPAPGTGVAVADPGGPEVPTDSGVTELAMGTTPDSQPASGPVPIAPVTPDLPEQSGTLAGGDAPVAAGSGGAGLADNAPDAVPNVGSEVSTVVEDAATDDPVLEIASVEPAVGQGTAATRGLQAGNPEANEALSDDPGGVAATDDATGQTMAENAAEADQPPLVQNTAESIGAAEDVDTQPSELAADTPAQSTESPSTEDATGPDSPVVMADGSETPAAATTGQIIETAGIAQTPDAAAAGGNAPVASEGVGDLAMVDDAGQTPVVAAETPVASGDAPSEPAGSQPDAAAAGGNAPVVSEGVGDLAMVDDSGQTPVVAAETPVDSGDAPSEPAGSQPDAAAEGGNAPVISADTQQVTAPDGPSEGTDDAPEMQAQIPTVLLADSQGIRVIQSGETAPRVQSQVTLDTIAYDTVGDVVLAGRGRAESDVRFYLNNQPIHLAPIDVQGGWRTALPQVDPGTYTLRLDEVSADGAVQSRIETPFLREEPDAVAAITSSSGENVITVQWGNTLWGIAQQHLGDGVAYVQIYEANREQIRNPDLIYPGQIFTLPETDN